MASRAETDFYPQYPGQNGARHCDNCEFAQHGCRPEVGYSGMKHYFIEYLHQQHEMTPEENAEILARYEVLVGGQFVSAMLSCVECPEDFVLTAGGNNTNWKKLTYKS